MRYVQRDENGDVIGHYANEQSFAKELLEEDHPDIEAFRARAQFRRDPPVAVRVNGTVIKSPFARGFVRVMAKKLGMTEEELLQEIKIEGATPFHSNDPYALEGLE